MRIHNLLSAKDLAERAGTSDLVIVTQARANGIKPVCILNGMEHYDPADLPEDAMRLLRPSQPDGRTLLRPPTPVEDDVLVRPAERH